jgi:hypothetical protein
MTCERYVRFAVVLLSLAVCPTLAAAQNISGFALGTVWGPESFVREAEEPVTAHRQFSLGVSEGPYVLHVRNGDGQQGNRVSSAKIWFDGQLVFGPSDFSLVADDLEAIVVPRSPTAILQVELNGAPQGTLTVWLSGRLWGGWPHEFVVLDPKGGDYLLANGIGLHVPPGAVAQPTPMGMALMERLLVEPLLQNGVGKKYFIAGFDAVPTGLQFNQPIHVTLPAYPVR